MDTLYQVDTSKGPEGVHLCTDAAVLCRNLTGIDGNYGFQLFFYVLLNLTLSQNIGQAELLLEITLFMHAHSLSFFINLKSKHH